MIEADGRQAAECAKVPGLGADEVHSMFDLGLLRDIGVSRPPCASTGQAAAQASTSMS